MYKPIEKYQNCCVGMAARSSARQAYWYSPTTRRNFTVPHGGVKIRGLPQYPQTGGDRGRRRPLNLTEADVFHLQGNRRSRILNLTADPDCLTPPNGPTSFEKIPVLTETIPYSSASATRQTRAISRAKKYPARPKIVSLAMATTCSVSNLNKGATGPKVSSA